MDLYKICAILLIFSALFYGADSGVIISESGTIILILLKMLALKKTLIYGAPIAIGVFIIGSIIGLILGLVGGGIGVIGAYGGFHLLRIYLKVRHHHHPHSHGWTASTTGHVGSNGWKASSGHVGGGGWTSVDPDTFNRFKNLGSSLGHRLHGSLNHFHLPHSISNIHSSHGHSHGHQHTSYSEHIPFRKFVRPSKVHKKRSYEKDDFNSGKNSASTGESSHRLLNQEGKKHDIELKFDEVPPAVEVYIEKKLRETAAKTKNAENKEIFENLLDMLRDSKNNRVDLRRLKDFGNLGKEENKIVEALRGDLASFFSLVELFDFNRCLQKFVCAVQATPNRENMTDYELNILATFNILKLMVPSNGKEDSTTKYRVAARIGETIRSESLCAKIYNSCNYSTKEILEIGSQLDYSNLNEDFESVSESESSTTVSSTVAGEKKKE